MIRSVLLYASIPEPHTAAQYRTPQLFGPSCCTTVGSFDITTVSCSKALQNTAHVNNVCQAWCILKVEVKASTEQDHGHATWAAGSALTALHQY